MVLLVVASTGAGTIIDWRSFSISSSVFAMLSTKTWRGTCDRSFESKSVIAPASLPMLNFCQNIFAAFRALELRANFTGIRSLVSEARDLLQVRRWTTRNVTSCVGCGLGAWWQRLTRPKIIASSQKQKLNGALESFHYGSERRFHL